MSYIVGYPLHGPSMRTLEEWHYDAYHAHSTKGEPLLDIVAERDALRAEVEKLRAALHEAADELDAYYRAEYPGDHPYSKRKLADAMRDNPARAALEAE